MKGIFFVPKRKDSESLEAAAIDDNYLDNVNDDADDVEDVLSSFRDTDVVGEVTKPVEGGKTKKYQTRHQSLNPSPQDLQHFTVDKDELGR